MTAKDFCSQIFASDLRNMPMHLQILLHILLGISLV